FVGEGGMSFHVGQRVVCIKRSGDGYGWEILPRVGGIYTIRGFDYRAACDEKEGVWLEEIVNKPAMYMGYTCLSEASFGRSHFRPVTERKTDISIFKRMLVPAGRRQRQVA